MSRLLLFAALVATSSLRAADAVTLREAHETIPTYRSGPPDPNPMFYFGRQSQGAEGRIYPYPLYDNLTNERGEQTLHLLYLENEFVQISIAPEIGGRLFSARDKTNGYDFVYRQHVIKPALIGLIGAWISGGIEWNIPHHHRASTFLPVQWRAEENADGSKTVWVGELELRHRMRWAVGYTLRPGSSVLECSVRISNRTPAVNTMLCFANLAVHANEEYQIIFPPRTQWVTFHAKNQFSQWPISHQRYSGSDFTAGVDVSWYKHHLNANSMFAWNDTDDFFAGYDHGRHAGTLSIADHHVVPGKKFWTWGSGARGRMWDDILTDADGPYIELMTGAYSDNQPDYSWLQPFELRAFTLNWYPLRDIGGVKEATIDGAVNLDIESGGARMSFNTTRAFPHATAQLTLDGHVLAADEIAISPAQPYTRIIPLPANADLHRLRAALLVKGREVVGYTPIRLAPQPMPPAYTPPAAPKDIANTEELYLAGQRADQFHSPSLDADPFWIEALRRDPGDIEANTGLGRLALRRAQFAEAEAYFQKAVNRLTANYTTPKNAEPLYHFGVAQKAQGKIDAAIASLQKAAWSQEWKSPAFVTLAEIATLRRDFASALDFADRALDANALNARAYAMKSAALRHLNRGEEASQVVGVALRKTDPLDVRLMAERWLADGRQRGDDFQQALAVHPQNAQELAADYLNAGLWSDGMDVLEAALSAATPATPASPLLHYYLAYFAEKAGDDAKAARALAAASATRPDYVFPFQAELISVLHRAITSNPQDARAHYYLGNLLFDWQPTEAMAQWEQSVALDSGFAIAWRNLAQAYAHQPDTNARTRAISCLERAVALPSAHATHFAELDQLYAAEGVAVARRLEQLEHHATQVVQKDDGRIALTDLKTFVGKADEAIALLRGRTFSVWEGGTRYNTGESWTNAHLVRGRQRLAANRARDALADFEAALNLPANLRSGERVAGANERQAEFSYWKARALDLLGERAAAQQSYAAAAADRPPSASGRSRGPGNTLAGQTARYYQAIAWRQLGNADRAATVFRELVATGGTGLNAASGTVDPNNSNFSQRDSARTRTAQAHYTAGLGHAGLGEKEAARASFTAALAATPDLLAAKLALEDL